EGPGGEGPAEERGPRLRPVGVGVVTLGVVACPAVGTVTAGDGGWDDDAVTGDEVGHVPTHLLDHADPLVAQDGAGLHAGHGPADHVQVGSADRAGGQPHDRVAGVADARLGDVFQ